MSVRTKFSIRLLDDLRTDIEVIAKAEKRTFTDCVNHILLSYVENYKKENNIMKEEVTEMGDKKTITKEILQIRVNSDLGDKIRKLATDNHRSVSKYVELLLEDHVKESEVENHVSK